MSNNYIGYHALQQYLGWYMYVRQNNKKINQRPK